MHLQMVVSLLLFVISTSAAKRIILIPRGSLEDTQLEDIAEGSTLTIECAVKGDKSPLWLYNGKEFQVVLESAPHLHFAKFNPAKHTGYYECVEPETLHSAAVRIEQRGVTLPSGYIPCTDETAEFCSFKGQCGVSLAYPGEKICSCIRGWYGKRCDRLNPLKKRRF